MKQNESIKIIRDVDAHLIPSGERITILKGEPVNITQALGGTYTLYLNGNLVQISGEDADAIGKETLIDKADFTEDEVVTTVDEQMIWDQLKSCYDPEIPVNIVDLGLIYDCRIVPLDEGGTRVEIKMTLTAPGCGMGDIIAGGVKQKIESVPGVTEVHVELVWEPQWNMEMMSEAARLQIGLL